jgi:hypothetical protein
MWPVGHGHPPDQRVRILSSDGAGPTPKTAPEETFSSLSQALLFVPEQR